MQEGESSSYQLSDEEKAMLERHSKDLEERAERSRDWQEKSKESEWTVELPKRANHPYAGIGRPEDVKKGDKPDMTGHFTRGNTHPHGKDEVTLDRRTI